MKPVLFDTGVIVAALLRRDARHEECSAFVRAIRPNHTQVLTLLP